MRNKILILLMMVMLLPTVMAYEFEGIIPAGEEYIIQELPNCQGMYQLKIRGTNEFIENEYSFPGCSMGEKFYECKCIDTGNQVKIITHEDAINEYDIVVQYYISPIKNPNTIRVININNAQVGPVQKDLSEYLPDLNKMLILIIVVVLLVLVIIVFGLIMLWKMVMDSEENSIDQFTPVDHDKVVAQSKKIIKETGLNKDNESDDMQDELQNILDDLD